MIAPVLQRELIVRGRSWSTYLIRTISTVIGLIVLLVCLSSSASGPVAAAEEGSKLFNSLLQLLFVFAMFEGVRSTAFGLVEERRHGTLGLLFLTSMRGRDVLLGKLGGSMASTLFSLLAASPLMAVPLLLGGVSLPVFLAGVSVVLTGLAVSMACGAYASATAKGAMDAMLKAFLILALFLIAPIVLGFPVMALSNGHLAIPTLFSPLAALVAVPRLSATVYGEPFFWFGQMAILLSSLAFIFATGRVLRINWASESLSNVRRSARKPVDIDDLLHGLGKKFYRLQKLVPAAANPLSRSLAARLGLNRWLPVFILIALAGSVLDGVLLVGDAGDLDLFWIGHVLLFLASSILFSYVCVQTFAEARASGEIEILMTTPLTDQELIATLWRLFRRLIGWTVSAELFGILLMNTCLLFSRNLRTLDKVTQAFLEAPVAIIISILFYSATAWLGMWIGIRSKSTGVAVTKVFLTSALAPVACVTILAMLYFWKLGTVSSLTWLPNLLLAIYWLSLLVWARRKLRRGFRVSVTR